MAVLVTDPDVGEKLIAARQAAGADRFDEVWEGIYVMSPLANDEHQDIQAGLIGAFKNALGWSGPALVRGGVNVSDRDEDWKYNFRCPDVVVFLPGTSAQNRDSHWFGGPDFAVEILSPGDRTREKLPFYASVNVRELLVIDRHPWSAELYRLRAGRLVSVGRIDPSSAAALTSEVLPLSFRFTSGVARPGIEVAQMDSGQTWLV